MPRDRGSIPRASMKSRLRIILSRLFSWACVISKCLGEAKRCLNVSDKCLIRLADDGWGREIRRGIEPPFQGVIRLGSDMAKKPSTVGRAASGLYFRNLGYAESGSQKKFYLGRDERRAVTASVQLERLWDAVSLVCLTRLCAAGSSEAIPDLYSNPPTLLSNWSWLLLTGDSSCFSAQQVQEARFLRFITKSSGKRWLSRCGAPAGARASEWFRGSNKMWQHVFNVLDCTARYKRAATFRSRYLLPRSHEVSGKNRQAWQAAPCSVRPSRSGWCSAHRGSDVQGRIASNA